MNANTTTSTLRIAMAAFGTAFLLAAAGQTQQSPKAPEGAKPPKPVMVQPGKLDEGAKAIPDAVSCENLLVVIQDASSPAATVSNVTCDHGYNFGTSPSSSNPGQPSTTTLQQSLTWGPNCTITVSKGSATAVLAVQQNYCYAAAGNITASVISGNATLNGTQVGSFPDTPGTAWFTIN